MCLAILLFLLSAEKKIRMIAMLLVVVMMSSMILLISGESNGKFNQTVRSISRPIHLVVRRGGTA